MLVAFAAHLAFVVACSVARAGEVATLPEALAAMRADDSAERERGERWLEAHAAPEHLDALRAALAEESKAAWELRARVRNALAGAARGMDLAIRLAGDADEHVAWTGSSALEERVVRWDPAAKEAPASRGQVAAALAERFGETYELDARLDTGRADLAMEELVRFARGALPIVVEPGFRPVADPSARRASARGTFDRLVADLARAHGLGVQGFGFGDGVDDPDAPRSRRWILLRARADEEAKSALPRLVEWCRAAADERRAGLRRDATRALGACGWPDAVAWMEERWLASIASDGGENAWLDGLLAAAGHGAIAPALARRESIALLHRWIAEPASAKEPELWRERVSSVARALALIGPRDDRGREIAALAKLDLARASNATIWAKLVAWEGMRAAGDDGERAIDALLDDRAKPPSLVLQALRTRAAIRPRAPSRAIETPEPLFDRASRTRSSKALVRALVAASVEPPARWDDPAVLPATWLADVRLEACAWELERTKPDAAARHLAALAARDDDVELLALAKRLRAWTRELGRDRVRAALEGARANAGAPLAERIELLATSVSTSSRVEEVVAHADLASSNGLASALALGTLVTDGDARARTVLFDAAASASTDADAERARSRAALGLDWAVEALRSRREDAAETDLVRAVRAALRAAPGSSSGRARFAPEAWPSPPELEPIVLGELDRELPPELR